MTRRAADDRGIALVLALLALATVAAAGLGIALVANVARMTASTAEESLALLNAAESALELAARDLSLLDLDEVLAGIATSARVDGAPGPRTVSPGLVINLVTLTNRLTCGRVTACTNGQRKQITTERPWGANNPRWRLFLHDALTPPPVPGPPTTLYVVVWVGDDAREDDDEPTTDGAGVAQEGRYIVRARSEAFGPRGGRRAIEAELVRQCTATEGAEVCLPGSRVQSWRAITQVP